MEYSIICRNFYSIEEQLAIMKSSRITFYLRGNYYPIWQVCRGWKELLELWQVLEYRGTREDNSRESRERDNFTSVTCDMVSFNLSKEERGE